MWLVSYGCYNKSINLGNTIIPYHACHISSLTKPPKFKYLYVIFFCETQDSSWSCLCPNPSLQGLNYWFVYTSFFQIIGDHVHLTWRLSWFQSHKTILRILQSLGLVSKKSSRFLNAFSDQVVLISHQFSSTDFWDIELFCEDRCRNSLSHWNL